MKNLKVLVIGNQEIVVKEFKNQRVVTFKDIDQVHERSEGTARKRFNDNKKHFIEGTDFFVLNQPSEIRTLGIERPQGGVPEKVTLITESGYLMLVKSFTDDLAWKVQRQLVKSYFRKTQESFPKTIPGQIQLLARGYMELEQKVDDIDKDLQEFKRDIPLLGVECQKIVRAKNRKVVPLMGGKEAPAYKDNSLRGKVYRDIDNQLRREFDVDTYKAIKRNQIDIAIQIINGYELPMKLKQQINFKNSQMSFV